MKVFLNDTGYIVSYALEGELLDALEVAEPDDLADFEEHFTAYRVNDGNLVFDEKQGKTVATQQQTADYRMRRAVECFPIINRGGLWYDTLTQEQQNELRQWYRAWLDGTDTLTVPERPTWLK